MIYQSQKRLLELVLGASIIGAGCTAMDVIATTSDIGLEENIGGIADRKETRAVAKFISRSAKTEATKQENKRVKYEDANVDIYRQREESKIRIAEEKVLNDFYDKSPSLSKSANTRITIDAVINEYKRHPGDWERNVDMIANAYGLEGLTSGDKGKLQNILETMAVDSTRGKPLAFKKSFSRKPAEYLDFLNNYWKPNCRRIMRDVDGKLKLYRFMINHPDTPKMDRLIIIKYYLSHIRIKSIKLSHQNAIDFIRTEMASLEDLKDNNTYLSKRELNSIDNCINNLEHLLQPRLAKIDPEFKEKIVTPEVVESAKEIQPETTPEPIEEPQPEIPEKTQESSSVGYWLTPLLAIFGLGGGASYKYRNFLYGQYKRLSSPKK